ncbi:unnamed protein product [Caenorhabditis auriculariae]|uniref:Uncharacterized protein n=1 Tax=Caenorhabditis auriculariae TaxID=2777116 RepID=A0A8S1GRZ1_9PELO|nr:unnamed protein product [Caenorhabditis auriculariae]
MMEADNPKISKPEVSRLDESTEATTQNSFPEEALELCEDEVSEPSPIDRRLKEGRSYNDGGWTSVELLKLAESLKKYGTQQKALHYIAHKVLNTRTYDEIATKVFEIRELVAESKEDLMTYAKNNWAKKGPRNVLPSRDLVADVDKMPRSWLAAMNAVDQSHPGVSLHTTREAVSKAISAAKHENDATQADVEDRTNLDVNWSRLYEVMLNASTFNSQLPSLNHLEAAILLKVLDDIDSEAYQAKDEEKAVMNGWFSEICMEEMGFCEPDTDARHALKSALQVSLDPLRTRAWSVPLNGAEPKTRDELPKIQSSAGKSRPPTVGKQKD